MNYQMSETRPLQLHYIRKVILNYNNYRGILLLNMAYKVFFKDITGDINSKWMNVSMWILKKKIDYKLFFGD